MQGSPANTPPPAAALASLISYNQPEYEETVHASISYLALRLVRALQVGVGNTLRRASRVEKG